MSPHTNSAGDYQRSHGRVMCRMYLEEALRQGGVWSLVVLLVFQPGFSFALDLSNEPMETRVQSAPANIMFVLDNSGSMDWEFATSENEGKFSAGSTVCEYLYDNPGDNTYSTSDSNGTVLGGSDSGQRGYWKSQWYGYNRLYYNPAVTYQAWPGKENIILSGLKAVRSNPQNATPVVNLTAQYLQVDPYSIIVDNTDAGFSKSSSGWSSSTSSSDYGSDYYYTTSSNTASDWARWEATIEETGSYSVGAWWVTSSSRRTNVVYAIEKNGSVIATTSPFNQQNNGGQWNTLGTYALTAGDTVAVILETTNPGSSRYCADAVRFRKDADPISISLIHYYVWHDADLDEVVDFGEVYLVNFVWTDTNTNTVVEEGELTRDYYQVRDGNGNNKVEDGELRGPLTGTGIPEAIKARRTVEGGGTTELTISEEALNFANWFAYYRKRTMAAKYAVSAAISDFDYVNVGFYTINDNGDNARIPVKPVHVEKNSLILDNLDNGFTKSSSGWSESGHTGEYLGSSLVTSTTGKYARWTPNIPQAGEYRVYAWWVDSSGNRDQNACYRVQHASGNTGCIRKNQRQNVSQFNLLGTYSFNVGTAGYVEVERNAPNGSYTSADAVMFEPVSGGVSVDETDSLRGTLYGVISDGNTPLRTALYAVGRYFDVEDTGGFGTTPYVSEAEGGACQQAFAILMTDGYYNDSFSSVGNVDNGMVAPYGDSYSNTLADIATHFYNTDLADNLPDQMPTNNYDTNVRQHMVTYTVAYGVEGTISLQDINGDGTPDAADCCYADDPYFLNTCTPRPVWPDPDDGDLQRIDDLWHASVNGHGQFFSAASPDELVASLKEVSKNIKSRLASGASVSVNGEELNEGTVLYQATYNAGKWTGNVVAYPINATTGEIQRSEGQELWQASDELQGQLWSDRRIVTSDGATTGLVFDYASLTALQQTMLGSSDVVNFLRGQEVSGMRVRDKKLGDIVHSAPLLTGTVTSAASDGFDNDGDGSIDESGESVGGTVFAGGNDGMLHAFNAQTGEERFVYVPGLLYGHLAQLARTDYTHRFYVDATPYSKVLTFAAGDRTGDGIDNDGDGSVDEADENYGDGIDNNSNETVDEAAEKKSMTLLVGGLGRGGKGYYCLDITHADDVQSLTSTADLTGMVKWEYPRRYFDGIDNNHNGLVDDAEEAALVSSYVYSFAGDQRVDGLDNDGDGYRDADAGEMLDGFNENYSDGRDNDWNGTIDEQGEKAVYILADADGIDNNGNGVVDEAGELTLAFRDDDLGYGFSAPYIVRSYRSMNPVSQTDHPWVVIFGNGYDSYNGHAVLYVLNALTGELIRKIDTGVGGNNGLSSPAVVDVNDDDRADFVYAGDLLGNMWKFDLTSTNPVEWRVAHEDAAGVAQPMFSAPGQPITTRPDVMYHCSEHGYMVLFGTGKFLGESDRTDGSQQTIFGIWDYGDSPHNGLDDDDNGLVDEPGEVEPVDRREYPGTWTRATNTLSNVPNVRLQQQVIVDERYSTYDGSYLRTVSVHEPHWYFAEDATIGQLGDPVTDTTYCGDSLDNDKDSRIDESSECDAWDEDTATCQGHVDTATTECIGHVGWYFDLPGKGAMDGLDNDGDALIDETGETSSTASERVIKDVIIRDGKLVVLTFIPDASPCSGGGSSILHEFAACSGGRLSSAVFDITGDKEINEEDLITIGTLKVPPTGKEFQGLLHPPVFLTMPDGERELKIFSSSAGTTEVIVEKAEQVGMFFWREVNN